MHVNVDIDDYSDDAREIGRVIFDLVAAAEGDPELYAVELARLAESIANGPDPVATAVRYFNVAIQVARVALIGWSREYNAPLQAALLEFERAWPKRSGE